MALFNFCSWPIWQGDDFTQCFHQKYVRQHHLTITQSRTNTQLSYLGTLFPLLVIGLCFLTLFCVNIGRIIPNQASSKYEPLATDPSTAAFTDTSRNLDDSDSSAQEDSEHRDMADSGSFFEDDADTGYCVSDIVEAGVIAALLAIRVIVITTTA